MSALQISLQKKLNKLMKKDQWEEVSCPLCLGTKKTAGFVCNDSGGIGFNCFKCKTKMKWAPPKKLTKKFKDLLGRIGFTDQELKDIDLTQ